MNKFFSFLAMASAAALTLFGCKTPEPDPVPVGAEFAVTTALGEPATQFQAAASGEVISLSVRSNVAWSAEAPGWVAVSPSTGDGDSAVSLTVSENTGGARTGDVTFKYEGGSSKVTVEQAAPAAKGIASAADFVAFAAAVNAGESTEAWENAEGWVNLLADLDFAGVTGFEPVGHVTAPWDSYNPVVKDGHPFTGKFDGNAHHIKNLKLTCAESEAGRHFGLFGYLGPGAIVQNFVIDENCSLTVTASVSLSAGLIAGVVYDATIRDVTSYAPMTYNGGATGYFHMALIGGLYAKDEGCIVDSVHNRGAITAENSANLNAGATGLHVAGIVGFANAPTGNARRNVISDCSNHGEMTSQAGRTAGILGAANACTDLVNCENRGNQLNTMPKNDGTRLGNIVCFTNNGSSITGCKNYGDLISTTAGRVGGIVSLPNAGEYTNNENYGEIISDSQYRGVFFGYVTQAAAWQGGKATGKVGTYSGGNPVYDLYPESDKVKYLGKDGSSGKATYTGVEIDIATGDTPVTPDPGLDVPASFRILFIGNSFTKDAVEHLPGILSAAGLNDIQMIHMYYGGRTIPEYNDGWSSATDYHCYVCNPGKTGWTDISGKSLAVAAASGKFDIVTIQEHTGRQLAWGWTAAEETATKGLVEKVKAAQAANGASPKLYYILSQAYHDLSKAQNVTKPFNNTAEMWTVIAAQGKTAVETCGFDGVISTGAMLQNLRTSSLNNSYGLTRDGYHMDNGLARYGAACTVFETVIGPFNGNKTMDGNSYRYNVSSTVDGSRSTPVTDESAPVAIQAARYAKEKPYEVTNMGGETPEPPGPVEGDKIAISDAAGLKALADRVNKGEEAAIYATVTLTSDIDCSSLSSWTPIGYCTLPTWAHNSMNTSGNLFCGSFDGQGHSIRNLHLSFSPEEAAGAWGLFGGIGKGGSVKNLVFDASCSLELSTSKSGVFGMLAGLLTDGSVSNVKTYGTLKGGGTSSLPNNAAGGRVAVGGLIGWVMAASADVTTTDLYNGGHIGVSEADPFTGGANVGTGANGFMVGGLIGFSSNCANSYTQTHTRLVNDGVIHAKTGRCSGIVSSSNRYTILKDCTNNGDVYYYSSGSQRPANITCILGDGSVLDGCVNRGDLIAPNCDTVVGVAALVSGANAQIRNTSCIGATVVGKKVVIGAVQTYNGMLYGNCNSSTAVFSNCSVSGRIGPSLDNLETLTAENYFLYVGQESSNATVTKENITFAASN